MTENVTFCETSISLIMYLKRNTPPLYVAHCFLARIYRLFSVIWDGVVALEMESGCYGLRRVGHEVSIWECF